MDNFVTVTRTICMAYGVKKKKSRATDRNRDVDDN